MEILKKDLVKVGFSENEAEVYLALLERSDVTAGEVSRVVSCPRATVYTVLEQLGKKGVVLRLRRGEERVYRAEHPSYIHNLLEVQRLDLEGKMDFAQRLIPRLTPFFNDRGEKPSVRYFEGLKGLRALQQEHAQFTGDIIQIVAYDLFSLLHDPQMTKEYTQHLVEERQQIRAIILTEKKCDEDFVKQFGLGMQAVCLSKDVLNFEGEMTVVGEDKLVLFSYSTSIMAVEITSKSVAGTARAVLELAWREANRLAGKAL